MFATIIFDIAPLVLQREIFVQYMFIILVDFVIQTTVDLIKENGFVTDKKQISYQNYIRGRLRK